MKIKINSKIKVLMFLSLSIIMASSFVQKVYCVGVKDKTRQNIAQALSIAGEKIGYRKINLDPRLVALTSEELIFVNKHIEKTLKEILKPNYSDIDKSRAIYDYIVENLSYDHTTVNNSAYQALKQNRTMCAGYSQLFYLMSKQAGLDVTYVIGEAGNDLHIWNKIIIDKKAYNIDTTWADKRSGNRYKFFLINDEELSKTHTWKL